MDKQIDDTITAVLTAVSTAAVTLQEAARGGAGVGTSNVSRQAAAEAVFASAPDVLTALTAMRPTSRASDTPFDPKGGQSPLTGLGNPDES